MSKKSGKLFETAKLDEREERNLLQIEHRGFWTAYWLLLAIILTEMFLFQEYSLRILGGEWIVFFVMSAYTSSACLKKGLWSGKIAATPKNNLILSVIGGLVMGVFTFGYTYRNYGKFFGSLAAGVFVFLPIFLLCLIALELTMRSYYKKVEELENEPEEDEIKKD
ncbi:MAG: hypothetical protein Q4C50_05160 [Eubacteriales bacterium]|nr:hypothetical protein [Eubacteriales bacterium]